MELEGVDHVALSVRDLGEAKKWYMDVLGLEHRYSGMWNGVPVFIGKGTTSLALFPAKPGTAGSSSSTEEVKLLHLAFRATRKNFLGAQKELERRGIQFKFQDHEISHSIYFRDPDGHHLEITP